MKKTVYAVSEALFPWAKPDTHGLNLSVLQRPAPHNSYWNPGPEAKNSIAREQVNLTYDTDKP